jgi:small subunit ribosomal protein S6
MNYEINFLILQSQTEAAAEIRKQVKELIKTNEGTVTDELTYQKRKLAYEINHEQYGFYTVYRFDLENGEKLKDLTKDLNLEKGVTRHIIVKSNEIPELQKEIGKAPKTEEERKAEAMKNAPKKKIGKKVLDEISKETPEKITPTETTEKAPKKKTTTAEKETSAKSAKKVTDQPSAGDKKDEISMDDLDKKLDEILDI